MTLFNTKIHIMNIRKDVRVTAAADRILFRLLVTLEGTPRIYQPL